MNEQPSRSRRSFGLSVRRRRLRLAARIRPFPKFTGLRSTFITGMTGKQFAGVFAISQLSPGPNVLIVTLIGYSVAGIFGRLAATLAMCGPTAVPAYYVSRLPERSNGAPWPAIIQAALVPRALIPALATDGSLIGAWSGCCGCAGICDAA